MPIDSRRLAVAFAGTSAFLDLYAPQSLLTVLAGEFDSSPAAVSLTITASTLAVALVAPVAGAFADVIGRKRVIVASAFALCLPTLMLAAVDDIGTMLFWRFVQGLFIPPIFAVTVAYIGEEWPAAEVGPVTGLYIGGTILGGFGGRFVTGLVAEAWNWQGAFVTLAAINLACAVVIAAFLPAERSFTRQEPGIGRSVARMALHLRNPRLVATYGIGFAILFSLVAAFTYINFRLAAPPFGLAPAALGAVFAVYLAGAVVTPISGGWVRRHGRRATAGAATAIAVAGLALTLATSLPVVIAGLGTFAVGVFVLQATATGFLPLAATEARAAAVGLYVTCYYVGGSIGAAAPSLIWTRFGWAGCVVLVALTLAMALALALHFWRPIAPVGSR